MARERRQRIDWDPVLIISQIIALQAAHYLVLCLFTPLLLSYFADKDSLEYEGGALNVGMIMDWREMAGRPTVHGLHGAQHRGWAPFEQSSNGTGNSKGMGMNHSHDNDIRLAGVDPMRGWVLAAMWMIASCADVYIIYNLVRRPKLVLDFTLTLLLCHVILTTYYSAALPTSLFFWLIMAAGAALTTTLAEQMCVKRELREGITIPSSNQVRVNGDQEEEMEMGNLRPD